MYFGAEHLIGFLIVVPSAQWYSYLRRKKACQSSNKVDGLTSTGTFGLHIRDACLKWYYDGSYLEFYIIAKVNLPF